MRIRHLNHSVYQTQYHIVWGTKYRRHILKHYVRTELIKSIYKVLRIYPTWYLHQINTGSDHVHLRIELPPTVTIAEAVQKLKGQSAYTLCKKFKFIREIYSRGGMWSVGYFVSTIGLNEDQIKRYIERQNLWERGQDVSAEFS